MHPYLTLYNMDKIALILYQNNTIPSGIMSFFLTGNGIMS
jgi:hypothetical protein